MKVICVDNFDRDYHPARVITVGGLDKEDANLIVNMTDAKTAIINVH